MIKIMKDIKLYIISACIAVSQVSCDNADELLDKYIENGPIVYAGKINDIAILSGYYQVGVNILPSQDVNKAYCMLKWNNSTGAKDSMRVEYSDANFDLMKGGYFKIISLPSIEGNILIEAYNIDTFGNKSLLFMKGGYVYGANYVNTLFPSTVKFAAGNASLEFDNKIGALDNIVSYEQIDGQFTPEVTVVKTLQLINPKKGGKVRSKTRYLINQSDVDILITPNYLETVIP